MKRTYTFWGHSDCRSLNANKLRKVLCAIIAILLLLTACGTSEPQSGTEMKGHYTYGVYELTFTVKRISGWPFGRWSFAYSYNGTPITDGHQFLYPLELFAFHAVQVEVTEKNNPGNAYSSTFPVAIFDGGSGKTEVTVTGSSGRTAIFEITCNVTQVGRK